MAKLSNGPISARFSPIAFSPIPTLVPTSTVPLPAKRYHFPILTFSKARLSLRSLSSSSSSSLSSSLQFPFHRGEDEEEEEKVLGDCLVFEEGIFDDPFLQTNSNGKLSIKKKPKPVSEEQLVPDEWMEACAEINMTKKEKKMIAKQLEFGSRVEKRKKMRLPAAELLAMEDQDSYRSFKLSQLNPVVLDSPKHSLSEEDGADSNRSGGEMGYTSSGRVAPKDPRLGTADGSLEDIATFFSSSNYQPGKNENKNSEGSRKLFTKEEKILLNKRIPNLAEATSSELYATCYYKILSEKLHLHEDSGLRKWLPLHTLAASGEFYLLDKLLKHNVDFNSSGKDGLTVLHKAILCRKQAIINYLLRESANPFVLDKEAATLMHYAVQVASSQTIKILLLYNVDINLADDDGWTPLHLAVQARRTDVVRLLLIKGADTTLKNRDGLTPLDLCLYSGRGKRTYELIKLLKEVPKS